MEEKLLETVELRRRYKETPACVILIDLDEFKNVNDQHGHAVGDEILIYVVEIISERLRDTDKLFRFGGEEFVVIADNTGISSISILAEQLRQAIDKATFPLQIHITISLGLAQYRTAETGFEWLGRADKALYQAKSKGRNISCIAA
jgi:diguanylate cyclase